MASHTRRTIAGIATAAAVLAAVLCARAAERGGTNVFPPPGTKSIKRGIVVPDDFELPPGYVRHYQTTDDGRRLPAILLFHPDYRPRDANGKPIPLPKDRVVPPEMAPPGLPIRMLDVRDAKGAAGPGR